jgi:hypothetical protein
MSRKSRQYAYEHGATAVCLCARASKLTRRCVVCFRHSNKERFLALCRENTQLLFNQLWEVRMCARFALGYLVVTMLGLLRSVC